MVERETVSWRGTRYILVFYSEDVCGGQTVFSCWSGKLTACILAPPSIGITTYRPNTLLPRSCRFGTAFLSAWRRSDDGRIGGRRQRRGLYKLPSGTSTYGLYCAFLLMNSGISYDNNWRHTRSFSTTTSRARRTSGETLQAWANLLRLYRSLYAFLSASPPSRFVWRISPGVACCLRCTRFCWRTLPAAAAPACHSLLLPYRRCGRRCPGFDAGWHIGSGPQLTQPSGMGTGVMARGTPER